MTTYTNVFSNSTVPPSEYSYRAVALTADVTLGWPENTTGTDVAAPLMAVTATGGSWAITLPAANEVSTGRELLIRNVGATSFSVKDNAGGAIVTVAAGEAKYVYLASNSSAAGTWSSFTYGTGTSGADSAALAGYGLASISNTLNGSLGTTTVSTARTVSSTDRAQLLAYTGGTLTWYLPDHATLSNGFYTCINNAGTGTLTLDAGTASSTIDGAATKSVQPGESLFVCCDDASGWYSVGYGRSNTFVYTQLVVDVSVGGTSAITVTSAQATNKLWYFYNTASGSRTVNIPAVASVYFVRVGAIGAGHTLTFTTGSGSAVTIAANLAYTIYCDGTNVVNATSATAATSVSLDDGSASSPALAYTLDTDTGMYRPGSNQFGVAAGGSMAAIFSSSASPTFAQPVSVANGGTGVATLTGIVKASGTSAFSAAVSGTDFKTINSTSILGSGNITTGSGDVVGPSSSVDSEIALFDSTTGKLIKRATTTGIVKATSGVIAAATAGTDYLAPPSGTAILKANSGGALANATAGTDYAKPDTVSSWTATQTFKGVTDTVYTITDGAAFEIDPANGSIQVVTLGASRTPAATNFASGQCVLLGIDDGSGFSITWTTVNPTWVKAGGTASAPTLATTGYTWVLLWKVGSTIYATEVGKP